MWLARTCSGVEYLLDVVVVRAFDLLARDGHLLSHRFLVDHQIVDLPLLRNPVRLLVIVEVLRELGVRRGEAFTELVGGEVHDFELHLLVALLEFLRNVCVRDGNPARERRLQLLGDDAAADLVLEVGGTHRRILHLQDLPVARVPDELTVLLERRQRENALANFGVAGADPEPVGLGERRLFLDHLLDDALIDAELLEQPFVDVAAVLLAVRLHLLLVDPPEFLRGDLMALDVGDDLVVARRAAAVTDKAGDIEQDERHHHDGKAPLEPALVAPHPVEHRHGCSRSLKGKTRLCHD